MRFLLLDKQYSLNAILLCNILMVCFVSACGPDDTAYKPTPYLIQIPRSFPTRMNVPADNPMTVEGIELGRNLFYDGRLSGRTELDSMMSCGTCHLQSNSFECGINHPKFIGGRTFGIKGILQVHVV